MATLLRTLLLLAASAPLAHADLGFPDSVPLPPQIVGDPDQALIKEDLAESEFESSAAGDVKVMRRGRHYQRWYRYVPAAGEPAPGYDNGTEERIFKAVSSSLPKPAWQLVHVAENSAYAVWHWTAGGKDSWLRLKMDAPQAQVQLELVEVGSVSSALVHTPPAARPETFGPRDPFPYLTPYPGSTLLEAGHADGPLDVTLAFTPQQDPEPVLVGSGVTTRSYQGPKTLSQLQFMGENRSALVTAGWNVLYPKTAAEDASNGMLLAHYTRNDRDLWARLSYEYGASLQYLVVDLGAEDFSAQFKRDCRLPLYGVRFDFNKASLRVESDAVLNKALGLLKSTSGAIEISGHTDNVGGDDYNLRLSEARAGSVRDWLVQHGIGAARLTAKGYGKTQPVADNGSDDGRARNRRVELVNPVCSRSRP